MLASVLASLTALTAQPAAAEPIFVVLEYGERVDWPEGAPTIRLDTWDDGTVAATLTGFGGRSAWLYLSDETLRYPAQYLRPALECGATGGTVTGRSCEMRAALWAARDPFALYRAAPGEEDGMVMIMPAEDEARRYLYVDYERPQGRAGDYYSIDLTSFIEGHRASGRAVTVFDETRTRRLGTTPRLARTD